jgi:formylglycine-generating enzyme required for sulfatase activity
MKSIIFALQIVTCAIWASDSPGKRIELARPGTLKEYIERYTGGADVGCSIGGQTFRNFQLRVQSSLELDKLKGDHPSPPMKPGQIIVTPVNYIKDGRRWIGFRFTNSETGLEILGGPHVPKDYQDATKKGHHIENCGFTSNYDIRFEVHGTSTWERGKVGYAGLATQRLVDGKWSDENPGPGSRGNFGFYPKKIGQPGGYMVINPKSPQRLLAGLSSVSRSFSDHSIAPRANENWFAFEKATAPQAFEVRAGYLPVYTPGKEPGLYSYGIWFRMNCWDSRNTRWKADYVEFAFSNATLTDEVWCPPGNPIAKVPQTPQEIDLAGCETITASAVTGESTTLDIADGISMKFVLIPAGKFVMGGSIKEAGRCDDEGPCRIVTISKPFYMGIVEVTQQQFEAVMGSNPSKWKGPANPVDVARFSLTQEFCKKASEKTGKRLRLPTEAEWEYACRAGSHTRFSFGDDEKEAADYCWYLANSKKGSNPVGQKRPNAWGLYDMHGNLWEWCQDMYSEAYDTTDAVDPRGPKTGEAHVVRGGSWSYFPEYCRSAARLRGSYNDLMDSGIVGFRVVFIDGEKPEISSEKKSR